MASCNDMKKSPAISTYSSNLKRMRHTMAMMAYSYMFNLYSALKILIKPYINAVLWISRNGCRIENCLQIVKI